MYEYKYIILADCENIKTRYSVKFSTRQEAQDAIDSLYFNYFEMIKMFKKYNIQYPPFTKYQIVEIRRPKNPLMSL